MYHTEQSRLHWTIFTVADPGHIVARASRENMAAAKLQLSAEEWKRIEDLARTN